MWDTWKNCKPGLQFFRVSHIWDITLIRFHSTVIPPYVFGVQGIKITQLMLIFSLEIWIITYNAD